MGEDDVGLAMEKDLVVMGVECNHPRPPAGLMAGPTEGLTLPERAPGWCLRLFSFWTRRSTIPLPLPSLNFEGERPNPAIK